MASLPLTFSTGGWKTFTENAEKIYSLYPEDSQKILQLSRIVTPKIPKGILHFSSSKDSPKRAIKCLTTKYGISHLSLPIEL